jgi:hypothetical protein
VVADQPVLGEQRPCPADLVGAQPLQGMGRAGPARAAAAWVSARTGMSALLRITT